MERDIKLSNIKGLLIYLVVLGHLISPYQEHYYGLYLLIYTFHMPLFTIISGYFAKRVSFKKIINLVLLYLIFQPIYRYFIYRVGVSDEFTVRYEHPYYQLWYLTSMIAWLLLLMIINNTGLVRINKVVLIGICFVIGCTSRIFSAPFEVFVQGFYKDFSPHFLSYQRTLYFLPYFFIGVYLSKDNMSTLYHGLKKGKTMALITSFAVYFYYTYVETTNLEKIFKGSSVLDNLSGAIYERFFGILFVYMIALVMCYVVLNAISDTKGILTKWGDHSLSIFIFHIFFARMMEHLVNLDRDNKVILLIIMILLSIAISVVLSSDLFVRYTSYLMNPLKTIEEIIDKIKKDRRKES